MFSCLIWSSGGRHCILSTATACRIVIRIAVRRGVDSESVTAAVVRLDFSFVGDAARYRMRLDLDGIKASEAFPECPLTTNEPF
jgi:hypothetical protein